MDRLSTPSAREFYYDQNQRIRCADDWKGVVLLKETANAIGGRSFRYKIPE